MFQVYVVGLKAVYCLGGLRFISQREYICIHIYMCVYIESAILIFLHQYSYMQW